MLKVFSWFKGSSISGLWTRKFSTATEKVFVAISILRMVWNERCSFSTLVQHVTIWQLVEIWQVVETSSGGGSSINTHSETEKVFGAVSILRMVWNEHCSFSSLVQHVTIWQLVEIWQVVETSSGGGSSINTHSETEKVFGAVSILRMVWNEHCSFSTLVQHVTTLQLVEIWQVVETSSGRGSSIHTHSETEKVFGAVSILRMVWNEHCSFSSLVQHVTIWQWRYDR